MGQDDGASWVATLRTAHTPHRLAKPVPPPPPALPRRHSTCSPRSTLAALATSATTRRSIRPGPGCSRHQPSHHPRRDAATRADSERPSDLRARANRHRFQASRLHRSHVAALRPSCLLLHRTPRHRHHRPTPPLHPSRAASTSAGSRRTGWMADRSPRLPRSALRPTRDDARREARCPPVVPLAEMVIDPPHAHRLRVPHVDAMGTPREARHLLPGRRRADRHIVPPAPGRAPGARREHRSQSSRHASSQQSRIAATGCRRYRVPAGRSLVCTGAP